MSVFQGCVKGLVSLAALVAFGFASSVALADVSVLSNAAAEPVIEAAPATCTTTCKIRYKHHLGCNKFKCCEKTEFILEVQQPCSCEAVCVPVCVPCCCEGVPEICSHKGILGRDVVEYKWCCGYHLKVVFDRCGDVTVHYYGK